MKGNTNMLGKDLIKWIKENKAENLPVSIQYRDGGGYYYGEGELFYPEIVEGSKDYSTGFDMSIEDFKRYFPDKNPKDIDEDFEENETYLNYTGKRIVL